MSKTKEFGSAARGISTKAELKQRLAARSKPKVELHYTMEGTEARTVNRQLNRASERRIKHLRERLGYASNRIKRDHLKSRLKGKSRTDFDRSR